MEQQKWHQVTLVELNCQHFNFRCQLELSVCVINPHECNLVVLCLGLWFLVKILLPPAASRVQCVSKSTICHWHPSFSSFPIPLTNWGHQGLSKVAWVSDLRFISLVAAGGGDDFHRHIHSCVLSEPQCTNAILCLKELHKIDDPESFFLVISLLLIIWHSGCNLMVWWTIYQGTNMPICTGAQVHNLEYSVTTQGHEI